MKKFTQSRASSESANNVYEELSAHSVATVATMNDDGTTHLSAVYYYIDETFTLSFATKRKTVKHRNLLNDNRVELLVFDERRQLTIQITGNAHEVTDKKLENTIVEYMHWTASQNDYASPPISKLKAGSYVAYQVRPKKISMALFLRPQAGGYDMFETLDFKHS